MILTRNGRPVAVLLGVEDEEELERLVMAYSSRLRTILQSARERLREGAGVRHEELWRELESR